MRVGPGLRGGRALSIAMALCAASCAGLPPPLQPVVLGSAAPLAGEERAGHPWPTPSWWNKYRDHSLDQLIEMALASSPTLATAHARFDLARQSVRIAGAAAGAQVEASADIDRQRLSDNGLFAPQFLGFHWYNQADLGLHASYTFDWWGKQRDAVAQAMDEAHAALADRSAAALVLASAVADTYFGWQADQNRLALARERETIVERERVIAAERMSAGLDAAENLQRSDLALASVREQIAILGGSASMRVVTLAALIGRSPETLPGLNVRALPPVAGGVPNDVKINLIARRADITASRWRVQAAERNSHATRGEFFPDVSVNALLGLSSINVGTLLQYGSRVPQVSAAIHLPIFDRGRLRGRYAASRAAIDAAVANYDDTVVSAAREVAMQAATRAQVTAQRSQRLIEVDAARDLEMSATARVRQGLSDARAGLSATKSWLEQQDALLQLDSAAVSSDIGLQRALGGGYESRQEVSDFSSTYATIAP